MKFAGNFVRVTGVAAMMLSGVAISAGAQTGSAASLPDAPSTTAQEAPPAVPTGPTVIIDTTMGRMSCKLFSKEAPKTVDNFIGLATGTKEWTDPATQQKVTGKPFYDGTTFHRVIPQFMIQGGDRLGTGMGDAGYFFEDEFSPALRFDVPGRLAMANSGPNTNGSQFFITEGPVPQLNGKHTIFGQCDTHSVLIVGSIARVERNNDDKPLTPVTINKVTIVQEGQPIPPDPMAAPSTTPATAGPAATTAPTATGTTSPQPH
jgi:peptidyl-prolyl cis-trans isomerase A (cyclophilin A)